MPSTYTTSLRLTLPATGELAGTWGTTVNAGVTSLAEAAIAGTAAVTMIDADYTLTAVNGAADQARNMFVTLTGTLTAARNVICPPVSKLYFVTNNTTGGYAITFKTLAGTGISVPNGQRAVLYCNGTDVVGGLTSLDSLSLNGSLTLVGGTANTVPYLNGSKVVTTGAALAFDGTNLSLGAAPSAWGAGIRGYEVPAGSVWSVSPTSIFLTSNAYYNGTNYVYKTSNASSQYQQGAGAHTWYVAASGTAGNTFTFTTAMTLNASGNLGVGTASPNARFTAGGNSSANTVADIQITRSSSGTTIQTGPNITFGDGTTNNTVALQATQGRFGVWNYGGGSWNERLSIDASGNVGLKVTPSAWSSVNYALQGTGGALFSTGANNILVGSNVYYDGAYKYVGAFNATLVAQSAGQHQWLTAAVGTAGAAISWTTAMTLDASGNLGLGVTPSAWLGAGYIDFPGNGYVGNAASYSGNTLSTGLNAYYGTGNWRYKQSSLAASRFDHTNGAFAWLTAPSGTAGNAITFTQAMTLDASGNLGIGTASPGYRLTVAGTAGAAVLNLLETGVRSWAIRAGGAATNTFDISDLTAGQTRLTLDSSGNLGLGVTPSAWGSGQKAVQIPTGQFASVPAGAAVGYNMYHDGTNYRYIASGSAGMLAQGGDFRFFTAPSGTAGNAITFTQAMTLDASGNFLVNETSAKYAAANRGLIEVNGTTSALLGLSVNNTAAGYLYSTSTNLYVGAPTGYNILFDINGEKMRLDSSGNLGLGVAPSAWSGRIAAQVYSVSLASPSGSPGIGEFSTNRYLASGGVDRYIYSAPAMVYQQDSGAHKWYTAPSGTAGNAITFTQAMTLDSSGNLGVGTVSPVGKLSVTNPGTGAVGFNAGTISSPNRGNLFYDTDGSGWDFRIGKLQSGVFTPQVTLNDSGNLGIGTSSPIAATGTTVDVAGASGASQRWRNNAGTSSAYLEVAAGATNFGNVSSTPITFVTAATERMRLDSSGNLGIGTASPASKLHVSSGAIRLSDGYELGWGDNSAYIAGNGTTELLQFFTASSERMRIDSTGNLGVGTTSPTSTLHVSGSFSRGVPVTKTSNFTLAATENWVIVDNSTSSVTATLPAPSSFPGRELMFVARYATGGGNLVSASSNVVQPDGTVTAVIIPYDVAGRYKFSTIVSDGTNWVVMNRGVM